MALSTEMISTFAVGDTTVRYVSELDSGRVGLELVPTAMLDRLVTRRAGIGHEPYLAAMPGAGDPPAWRVDALAHVKIVGDPYPGAFAQGRTMRSSESNDRFRFAGQHVDSHAIVTTLAADDGCRIEHHLSWHDGDHAFRVQTTFVNASPRPVTLEMLTSFSLGNFTPFAADDAPIRLRVHRFRSVWSAEGRLQTETIEQLHLERSWSGAGLFSERFGVLGTMPVRGWFPFVAVEDVEAGVCWGANVAWAGSWQMEVSRQDDGVAISGGLADREFGHWTKTLAAGESFVAPPATLACAVGGIDELCDRLVAVQDSPVDLQPRVEQDLPIVFNEWCTTWGDPRHERMVELAAKLCGSDVRYFVIDAGWFKTTGGDWGNGHGDWVPNAAMFPHGLKATADAIRARGLIPGLWFEMETVGDASASFAMTSALLKRDGLPITTRHRRFWNLNDSFAVDYLADRVIGTLRECGFGYLKVDYNETAGFGCDGAESQGEGLRRQVEASGRFFDRIRRELPDLVIENCSSGGHRLEPSMLARTAMSSFSDAHELVEIPIVAANLHRLMLPRQSQIWAVLHASDSDRRLVYSLAATFLGRMCLSGDYDVLSDTQRAIVARATALYRLAAPILKRGTSRRTTTLGESWRHPRGWQGVARTSVDGTRALVVCHAFADPSGDAAIPLPAGGGWAIDATLVELAGSAVRVDDANQLRWEPADDFSAVVVLLHRT